MSYDKIIYSYLFILDSHLLDNHVWQGLNPVSPVNRSLERLLAGGEGKKLLPGVLVDAALVKWGHETGRFIVKSGSSSW